MNISIGKNPELLVLFTIFAVTTFISIFIGISLFFIYLLLYKNSYHKLSFFFISYIYAIIAFSQYSTVSTTDYDIIRYYTTYDFFSESNFNTGWQAILIHGDIFFYTIVYFLSKIFPSDPRVLSLFFTFATSSLLFLSIDNFVLKYSGNKRYNLLSVIFWIFSFFLISSFPNMTNAYRQFFAMSLFLYAISRKEINKKYLLFFLLSILSHWSILIYLILYVIVNMFKEKINYLLFIIPFFSVFVNILLPIFSFSERINSYLYGEESLGVDKTLLVLSFIIQIVLVFALNKYKNSLHSFYVISVTALAYNFVFILNSTIITRHFFYVGFIVTIILVYLSNNQPLIFLNNKRRISFDIIIVLLLFYNIKNLILGGSNYIILENNLILDSYLSYLKTSFPYEIIR